MFNTRNFLKDLSRGISRRVTFYPSCGFCPKFVCKSNAETAIFSDYRPKSLMARRAFWKRFRQSCHPHKIDLFAATKIARIFTVDNKKWGIFLFVDNNIAIKMIEDSGLRISTFIGVCDGCGEGGNYECVNELPFFGKVLNLMPDDGGMYVISDHSPYFFDGDWGEPRSGDFSFMVKGIHYDASLASNRDTRFRRRTYEFIIRETCKVSALNSLFS